MKGAAISLLLASCAMGCGPVEKDTMFELLDASETNITFNNKLTQTDSFNVLTFEYIYNGAGVGVGDVNNDGLTDIFFAGNMVPSKLYLNKGDFEFGDVTEKANIRSERWCTGVALTDINQDGLMDIYVSTIQLHIDKPPVSNLLFLNIGMNDDGIPVFEEVAAKVGLADSSYSTQAAFLDYDLDGLKTLPAEAQFAPMYGIDVTDVNEDGNLDVLSVGNSYASEPLSGLYDAGIGNYLHGDGKGNFKTIPVRESGFFVDRDAKALAGLTLKNGNSIYLATQNRDSLKVFSKFHAYTTQKDETIIRIKPLEVYALIELKDGRKRKTEFYFGSGYLSSSSRTIVKDKNIVSIKVFSQTSLEK